MKNNECEIVKDLLPGYVEKTLRNETNEFVEEHTKNCNSCNEILKMIEDEKQKEIELKQNEEINYLKKYNKKVKILEAIAVILIVFILGAWEWKIIDSKRDNEAGKEIYDIIQSAWNNMKEFEECDNYIFTEELTMQDFTQNEKRTDKKKYYYKDEKYKEESIKEINVAGGNPIIETKYGPIKLQEETIEFGNETIHLPEGAISHVSFEETTNTKIVHLWGWSWTNNEKISALSDIKAVIPYTKILSEVGVKACSSLKLREEEYKGKICYVIRSGGESDYQEIWIDKEEKVVLREIDGIRDKSFIWEKGTVTDEDVKAKSIEGYEFVGEDWEKKYLP